MKSKRVEEETAACMNERKEGLGGWNGAAKGGTQRKRRGIRIGVRREERRGEERERGTEMMPKRPGERGPRSGATGWTGPWQGTPPARQVHPGHRFAPA